MAVEGAYGVYPCLPLAVSLYLIHVVAWLAMLVLTAVAWFLIVESWTWWLDMILTIKMA